MLATAARARRHAWLLVAASSLLAGCPPRGKQPARGADAAPAPRVPTPAYQACARPGARREAPPPVRHAGLELLPAGEVLEPSGRPRRPARLLLGALADTKEALPATLERLERLAGRFRGLGVGAVVVLGGLDQSYEGTRAVLERLRGLLVVGLPGDRESRADWQAAMEALRPRAADLTRARAVVLPGASLLGVPGYHLPHHLLAREQGCSYDRADLQAMVQIARRLPQPRLLLAHGPPRGKGATAIDRAFGEVNIGDPLLARLLAEGEIRFGLFAHVHESAGRATTLSGRPVREDEWSDELLLNVGAADSVPHEDLRGRWSQGSAALLEIAGARARYRMLALDEK